jgi:hypothetical protein
MVGVSVGTGLGSAVDVQVGERNTVAVDVAGSVMAEIGVGNTEGGSVLQDTITIKHTKIIPIRTCLRFISRPPENKPLRH